MKGIAVAGSVLVDKIYNIDLYPKAGELTAIKGFSLAVGGCVPNVSIDLKKLYPHMDIYAVGKVGSDGDGEYIKTALSTVGVDIKGIKESKAGTSSTLVMSVTGGERTFFTYSGGNEEFGNGDIDFDNLDIDMLHLGYFMLLDKVDNGDGLAILKEAKKRNIRTSIDLVSRDNASYSKVLPLLPYVDNLIINEIEASRLLGVPSHTHISKMAKDLLDLGVKERVIIHKPEMSVCVSSYGTSLIPSYDLPSGFIKGSTGAGDAFCAGSLMGIYNNMKDTEILEFASSVAAVSLRSADAVSGLCTAEEVKKICKELKRRIL